MPPDDTHIQRRALVEVYSNSHGTVDRGEAADLRRSLRRLADQLQLTILALVIAVSAEFPDDRSPTQPSARS